MVNKVSKHTPMQKIRMSGKYIDVGFVRTMIAQGLLWAINPDACMLQVT